MSYARLTAYQLAKINRRQTMMDRLVEYNAQVPDESEDESDLECGCDRMDSSDSEEDD